MAYNSYTNKYKKHVAWNDDWKLVCIDHNFSKPFKSALGDNFVCNFVSSMLKEGWYCTDIMKK